MEKSFRSWICKWLPIFFGCHCRPERSFFWKGRQLPLCARCTGELIGILAGIPIIFFWQPPVWFPAVLLIPLVLDGSIQLLTVYESNNLKRVITGFLFGYGLFTLIALLNIAAFRYGQHLAGYLREWR